MFKKVVIICGLFLMMMFDGKTAFSNSYLDHSLKLTELEYPQVVAPGEFFYAKIKFKNTGDFSWSTDQEYRLAFVNYDPELALGRYELSRDVLPDEEYDFYILLRAPLEAGEYSLLFQMLKEGEFWFGEKAELKIEVAGEEVENEIERIELFFDYEVLEHFENFAEESKKILFKRADLNTWHKAKMFHEGEYFNIEVKIHGGEPIHFNKPKKSYRVKVLDDKNFKGVEQFSLIVFEDRSYMSLMNQYLADKLDLLMLRHELVNVNLNAGDEELYYFREYRDPLLFEDYGFENAYFVDRDTVFSHDLNRLVTSGNAGHQNFLNFEFVYDDLNPEPDDLKDLNYILYLFDKAKEGQGKEVLSFFNESYIIRFEAIRALLVLHHDVTGDNLVSIFDDDTDNFFPLVGGESVYKYLNPNIEFHLNRDVCVGKAFVGTANWAFGRELDVFAALNRNADFRQKKYQYLYDVMSKNDLVDEIRTHLIQNYSDEDLARMMVMMDFFKENVRLLESLFENPKVFVLQGDDGLELTVFSVGGVRVVSLGSLVLDNFLRAEVLESDLMMNLDDNLNFIPYNMTYPFSFDVEDLRIMNSLTGELLDEVEIEVYEEISDYNSAVETYASYFKNDLPECQSDVGKDDFAIAKMYVSVLENKGRLELEFLPVGLSDMQFEEFELSLSNFRLSGKDVDLVLYDGGGQIMKKDVVVAEGGEIDLTSFFEDVVFKAEKAERGGILETKFFLKVDMAKEKDFLEVENLNMKARNLFNDTSLSKENIIYEVARVK